jgi:hypothetical protein
MIKKQILLCMLISPLILLSMDDIELTFEKEAVDEESPLLES